MYYTKGEWKERLVMGEREIYVDPNEKNISTEVICRGVRHWNAPLIKSAPDMYEALKVIGDEINHDPGTKVDSDTQMLILKALAKAEGGGG